MGLVQKDAFRTMIISYVGIILGYLNKGLLFLIILSTEQIGLISLIVALGTLFARFANFGVVNAIWKFLPYFKDRGDRNSGFLPLMLAVTFIGIAVFSLLYIVFQVPIMDSYREKSEMFIDYYYWVLPVGIAYVLYLVLDAYLRSLYKNTVSVFALDIGLRVSLTVLLFLFWFKLIDFRSFTIAHSLIYCIPTVILLVYLKRIKELNLSLASIDISKRFRKVIFQFSAFSYVNTLGLILVNSLDIMMIAQFVGLEGTGVYAIVIFLASALQVPYKSIIRVSSPLIADYWKHKEFDKMKSLYVKVSGVSLVLGLASFLVVWLNVDLAFSFLKPEFRDGIWVFLFLMLGRLFDMFAGLNGAIFITSKKYKYEVFFTMFLIVTVFLLNLLFIPWWGIAGAAISTSIALIAYNVARLIFVWRIYKMHPFTKNQFIIIGLAIVTALIGMYAGEFIENGWIQLLVECGIGLICFIFPIYYFSLEKESINYVKKGWEFVKSKLPS